MKSFKKISNIFSVAAFVFTVAMLSAQPRLLRAEEDYRASDAAGSVEVNSDEASSPSTSDAVEAGNEFSDGFKKVGRGIKTGALVTGKAFKKAGLAIKNYFTGNSSRSVEERDLGSQGSAQPASESDDSNYNSNLDRVGNSPATKIQSRGGGADDSDARL